MKLYPVQLLCFLLLVFYSACRKKIDDIGSFKAVQNTKYDTLRVFNLLPLRSNEGYIMFVNDTLTYEIGIAGNVSKYMLPYALMRRPGATSVFNVKIQIKRESKNVRDVPLKLAANLQPTPDSVVLNLDVIIQPNSGFENLFIYDSVGTVKSRIFDTRLVSEPPPEKGRTKLRVVNFGYKQVFTSPPSYLPRETYSLQLQNQDSSSVKGLESVAYAGSSPYIELEYGTYQFRPFINGNAYLNNSSSLNDLHDFIYPGPIGAGVSLLNVQYWAEPQRTPSTIPSRGSSVSSYELSPGRLYSLYVIGDAYTLVEDRTYGTGLLDDVAKVQFVNANFAVNHLTVQFDVGGRNYSKDGLAFGDFTVPFTVPAGNLSYQFKDVNGVVIYSGTMNAFRLSNVSVYLYQNAKGVPITLVIRNELQSSFDYDYPIPSELGSGVGGELEKVDFYNLSPDAGPVAFSLVYMDAAPRPPEDEVFVQRGRMYRSNPLAVPLGDVPFAKGKLASMPWDTYFKPGSSATPPNKLRVRYSDNRPDSLVSKLLAELTNPFGTSGNFSAVFMGSVLEADPLKKPRIIIVPHSHQLKKENFRQ